VTGTFCEKDCVIAHEGRTFEAGGAWLCDCADGYRRGVVYAKPDKSCVTTWHGELIAMATFGPVYRGTFCRMRSVLFEVDGVRYAGRWCPDWADAVRVRSTRKVVRP